MQRSLVVFAIVAVAGLVLAFGSGTLVLPFGGETGRWSVPRLEPVSFALGVVAAMAASWLRRLPWGDLMAVLAVMLRVWRRNAALAALALVFAGVLLFY